MRDNPEGVELEPAGGVLRRYEKNSPFLSCIGKRTREGCVRGSEVGTVHSGRDGKGLVPPRKPKKSGKRGSCDKNFVSKISECLICNNRGQWAGNMDKGKCCSGFGK